MGLLSGKVAIITGGGTGLGRAIAKRFADEDARVVICGRRMEKLVETAGLIGVQGENVLPLPCDVTDQAQILGLVKTVMGKFDGIDVLVNNAGVMRFGELCSSDEQTYELMMRTNVWAPWRFSVAVVPHMKQRGGGSIVTISSIAGLKAMSGAGLYCTSKAAVQVISQTLALEHAADHIRVNVICPALVEDTELAVPIVGAEGMEEFYNKLKPLHPLGRNGRPDDVADATLFFACEQSRWITGTILPLDGGRMLTSNRPKI